MNEYKMTDYCRQEIKDRVLAMNDEEIEIVKEALKEREQTKKML